MATPENLKQTPFAPQPAFLAYTDFRNGVCPTVIIAAKWNTRVVTRKDGGKFDSTECELLLQLENGELRRRTVFCNQTEYALLYAKLGGDSWQNKSVVWALKTNDKGQKFPVAIDGR